MTNEPIRQKTKTLVPIPVRGDEPRIELLREGNVIRTIRVSCSCGCEVDICCKYNSEQSQ